MLGQQVRDGFNLAVKDLGGKLGGREVEVVVADDELKPDVAVQKVNQTYSALVGAFSPYDEFALYTYSSTVTRVTDFTGRPERLTAAFRKSSIALK